MKNFDDEKWAYEFTTNRTHYNKLRKKRLADSGEIHCNYCGYNRGENSKIDWYTIHPDGTGKHPSWKLVTKNRKQWMPKPWHIEEDFELCWSGWNGNVKPYREAPFIGWN